LKVLVIANDAELLELISLAFRMGWSQATLMMAHHGASGVEIVESRSPAMVLMDLSLPDMPGFEVLSEIRAFSDVPIVVVTDRGDEIDRVKGLEMGADDYVVKPFGPLELLARVRAVLRRTKVDAFASPAAFDHGGIIINPRAQRVLLHGKEVRLTPIEYRLLCELVGNSGQIVSQQSLIEKVWGEEYLDTPKILKVHIHRLRRKLGDSSESPQMIVTVARRGYRFDLSPAEADLEHLGPAPRR
jgi:DNA-binding response OmpR family regulator